MLNIQFVNGRIQFNSENNSFEISEISQAYLVSDWLKQYLDNEDEQIFHLYHAIFDLFSTAKRQLIQYQELKDFICTKNLL
jgi:hypothetical protein